SLSTELCERRPRLRHVHAAHHELVLTGGDREPAPACAARGRGASIATCGIVPVGSVLGSPGFFPRTSRIERHALIFSRGARERNRWRKTAGRHLRTVDNLPLWRNSHVTTDDGAGSTRERSAVAAARALRRCARAHRRSITRTACGFSNRRAHRFSKEPEADALLLPHPRTLEARPRACAHLSSVVTCTSKQRRGPLSPRPARQPTQCTEPEAGSSS